MTWRWVPIVGGWQLAGHDNPVFHVTLTHGPDGWILDSGLPLGNDETKAKLEALKMVRRRVNYLVDAAVAMFNQLERPQGGLVA